MGVSGVAVMAACRQGAGGDQLRSVLDGVLLGRVSLENVNWNMGVRKMTDSGGLSWEAQEVLQKIKSFNRPLSVARSRWRSVLCRRTEGL
jgi:hypothetical protein